MSIRETPEHGPAGKSIRPAPRPAQARVPEAETPTPPPAGGVSDAPPDSEPSAEPSWPERARIEGRGVRTAFRVRYAETDAMGVAYYANYLVWFEVMRGDFMRAVGIPYTSLEAAGTFLPIAEAHVRYRASAHYDEVIEIRATIARLRSRSITFTYRVERSGQLLATGWTTHIPVNRDGTPRSFSPELLEALRGFQESAEEPGDRRPTA